MLNIYCSLSVLSASSAVRLSFLSRTAQKSLAPKPSFLFGHLTQFGRDPIGFLERCVRGNGDIVALRFLHRRVFLLNNPIHIEEVLATGNKHFRKTIGYRTP